MSGLNSSGLVPFGQAASVYNFASGGYTGDGTGSITVFVGFTPRYVKIIDYTTAATPIVYEWWDSMPTVDTLKTTGGAAGATLGSVDTTGLITTNGATVSVTDLLTGTDLNGQGAFGDGTQVNASITVEYANKLLPQLILATGLNTSAHTYSFMAIG